ncbi:MAG TPA: hypothetical protein VIN04_04705 [Myxococcota bacterium]
MRTSARLALLGAAAAALLAVAPATTGAGQRCHGELPTIVRGSGYDQPRSVERRAGR